MVRRADPGSARSAQPAHAMMLDRTLGRMRMMSVRTDCGERARATVVRLVLAAIVVLLPGVASAGQRLHGVVLAVTPKTGEAVVRHDPFGSMPGMTMVVRIAPRARAAQLQPGAAIDADVNTSTEPWTLSNVTTTAGQRLTDESSALRRVTPLHIGDVVPDTPFIDQAGKPFRFSQLRGGDAVLSFIFTRCRDARMCPLISAKFRQLQQQLGTRNVHLVEVTLDPAFDRPPVLARYGNVFGADPKRWSLIVGDAEPTLDFAAKFGIGAFPDPEVGVIHNENTVIIGPDGRIERMFSETAWLPSEILAAIDQEHGTSANPLARLNLWLSSAAVAVCGSSVAGFSGFADLAIVLLVFAALAYLVYRLARKIFVEST